MPNHDDIVDAITAGAHALARDPVNNKTLNAYWNWLIEKVGVKKGDVTFVQLSKLLFKKEFFWSIPNDDNRAQDGKALRFEFVNEIDDGISPIKFLEADAARIELEGPCRCLEMLIGLARRMEIVMSSPTEGDQVSFWFWQMIENLGLDRFNDDEIFEIGSLDQVDMILDRMVERTYKRNGEGGLFPLRGPKCCGDVLIEEGVYPLRDQRGVEIWYQMCDWMLENYMEK